MDVEKNSINENIKVEQLSDAISKRYLEYAMSTIVARSLPDVRDGLKPVHRRILYGMRQLKLDPKSGYKKCARVVGDVMGKYHPHGDASIYDAMVRLAQSFSVRYPLVMGQGNFGNIDGDSAAAMRYTEAKLTDAAISIMDGLDENSVDFMDTYSGEEREPIVMPSLFPNLLLNGANGIAVGMATNIPPHNVLEVIDAIVALIKNKNISVDELVEFIKAPDFPTGGVICETEDSIINTYKLGKGSFKVRAKWVKEDLSYSNYQIVITEIPYGVQKSRLIEKIADLLNSGKLQLVSDIRDESDENIRIVIEPKNRIVDPNLVMGQLFSLTELEVKFALNMNVLDKNCIPGVMNLKQVLEAYLDHQIEVLERRSKFRLSNINDRLNILNGYLITYLNLDRVIYIIREFDDAKSKLMDEFNLNDKQVEAILNMKLRSLKKLEEMEIKKEVEILEKEKLELQNLLNSDDNKNKKIISLLKEMRSVFAKNKALSNRLTDIDYNSKDIEINPENILPKGPISIVLSSMGWIKTVKNHIALDSSIVFKDGDSLHSIIHSYTNDKIILGMSNGQFFTIDTNKLPNGRGFGDPLNMIIDVPISASCISIFSYKSGINFLLATKNGYGFKVNIDDCLAQTKNGKQIVSLAENDMLLKIVSINKNDDMVAIVGNNRKFLIFPISDIPTLSKGKGVILQKYNEPNTFLSDIKLFNSLSGLSWKNGVKNFKITDIKLWQVKRATIGHMPPDNFPKSNKF